MGAIAWYHLTQVTCGTEAIALLDSVSNIDQELKGHTTTFLIDFLGT